MYTVMSILFLLLLFFLRLVLSGGYILQINCTQDDEKLLLQHGQGKYDALIGQSLSVTCSSKS